MENCILTSKCEIASKRECVGSCLASIPIHGASGNGGLSAKAMIPQDYRFVTIHNSPVREEQGIVYDMVDEYVKTFDRLFEDNSTLDTSKRIKNLYIWSNATGTGKTTTACAILNEFMSRYYINSLKYGVSIEDKAPFYLDVNELQSLYNKFSRPNVPKDVAEPASREYYRRLGLAEKAPLVLFDDLGVRDATDGFRGDLHSVINARVTNQLPSIYTSNFPLEEMIRVYDKRVADRISDLTVEIAFGGTSKRGKR